jgi:phosphoserine phosphatase
MISVIIPVLNESRTIRSVVALARRHSQVTEVIVVDDGSIDGTAELAHEAGARVIVSTLLGKGASMHDGMRAAANEVLVFLDGDLSGLDEELIEDLARPILDSSADFVKASFSRDAGRVTILTARPLLQTFFPELNGFNQPLGGIIAARRSLLMRLAFENDYGVDVGLLLDVIEAGGRVTQVDIGRIEHDSQTLEVLGDMATQVMRTILDRAARYGRLKRGRLEALQEIERRTQVDLPVLLRKVEQAERLALFDMDGVLLDGRFVVELARITGRAAELNQFLDHPTLPDEERTRAIARIFAGVPRTLFEQTARHMPLVEGAAETVVALRKAGFRVGIVTDSFYAAAETVRRRVFADFCVAHVLRFKAGKATGFVTLSPAMAHSPGCPEHTICKRNVLFHLLSTMTGNQEDVVAVGDGANDICLLQQAGRSFAFHPKNDRVAAAAKVNLNGSLREILRHLGLSGSGRPSRVRKRKSAAGAGAN